MYFVPKGFFEIPHIKGDMAQKRLLLFTMYGAHGHGKNFII